MNSQPQSSPLWQMTIQAKNAGNSGRDIIGEGTLQAIHQADQFNRWMYQTIKPYCHGKILEIGSGIGNLSNQFLNDGHQLMLSDYNEEYCLQLASKFAHRDNCLGVQIIDLVHPNFDARHADQFEQYDTLFALNVIEHIQDDNLAIRNARKLLKPGGQLIILVPAYQWLHNSFDQGLGHYRRYTAPTLRQRFESNDFKVIHSLYFNFVGIFGWFFSGSILGMKQIPANQMNIYNKLVPINKIIDRLLFRRLGLSTIVIGKK